MPRCDYRDATAVLALALFGAVVFGRYVPLDPDFHHDGIQFATAVAVSEGLSVHADAFMHYGPLMTWIQAGVLTITGPEVISLRILAAVLLTITAILMFAVIRSAGGKPVVALSVSALWTVSCPTWSQRDGVFAFFTMPSTLLGVLVLASILLVIRAEADGRKTGTSVLLAGAGILSAGAVLTRVNYALPIVTGILLYLAIRYWQRSPDVGPLLYFLGGLLSGLGAGILILAWQGALAAHVNQTVVAPLAYFSDVPRDWFYFLALYFLVALPFLLLAASAIGFAASRYERRWKQAVVLLLPALAAAVLVSLSLGTRIRIAFLDLIGSPAPGTFPVAWANAQIVGPLYASIVAMGIGLLLLIVKKEWQWIQPIHLVLFTALGSAAQLYPLFDEYHLWWAAPLPLAWMALAVNAMSKAPLVPWVVLALCIPYLIGLTWEWQRIASRDRVPAFGNVLQGMTVPDGVDDQLRDLDRVLSALPPRDTRFHCRDALIAAWSGEYAPRTAAHVSWAFGGIHPRDNGFVETDRAANRGEFPPVDVVRTSAEDVQIVCAEVEPGSEVDAWVRESGMTLVDQMGPFQPRYDRAYYVYRLERS